MERRDDGRRGDRGEQQRRNSSGRVPPHNLQAEESVLGAVLLSRDAIGAVSEQGLRPEDFYRPAHQHIFDAVRALYSAGAPADTITVADELRRAGLLEQVGGTEALHALQNATPAISNAAHYARIVQDTAILRRLIHVAGDIAEMAYSEPDDVTKAVDEAESKVFKVAEERVADSTQLLSESIKSVMDRLEETYARGDTITGTATGYHDIDELLSGLQPSTLNIVGARPAMGKCVAADTPVVDVATGEVVTAQELVERAVSRGRLEVRALGPDGRQLTTAVGACVEDGVKAVFRVRTRAGRAVTVTATHPLLTPGGWRPLGELAVGDEIAVPTSVPVFGADDADDERIDELVRAILRAGTGFPPAALRLRRQRLAALLGRLFDARGVVRVEHGSARVRFSTADERLADGVMHALLRFGIVTARRRHRSADREWRHDVEITDGTALVRFAEEIGAHTALPGVTELRRVAATGASRDTVPVEVWHDIDKARADLPWAEVARRIGIAAGDEWQPHRRRVARETVARLAEVLDDNQLRWWASPDVAWEPIVEITPLGDAEVVDFTVPALHNFVAADVYLHNTAFGLGMAVHVAQHTGKPVLVFSLEMGHNELTQRILSSEAKVDSTKLRNGRISEADWGAIGRAIGRLEVPLFLDDNPRVTVMEIRAKARRLKARHGGLALIVIDYLQLMSGGGNPENRQLEVSEISRNLKILARELEVPIVALSQLSRNLEARADKRPMLSDLRESGCLTADTRLVRADTNAEVTLGELVEGGFTDIPVWSLDEHYKLVPARLVRAFPSGTKDTFRIRFASGRTIDASANHPFLTLEGWSPVEALSVGDHLATARRLPERAYAPTMTDQELVLLGHLIGDGCTLDRHAVQYTTTDPANVAAVVEAAAHFGVEARVHRERTWMQVYLPSPFRLTHGRRHPISEWLRRLDAWNRRSWQKHVPREVFAQPAESIATFLRHLWATDGSVVVCASSAPRIYYATSSRQLADDVMSLLLRLDIRARICVVEHRGGRTGYHVVVSGRDDQLRFASVVGVHGARGAVLERLVQVLDQRRSDTNVDIVPKGVWEHVRHKVLPAIGMTARELAEGLGMRYCGSALYRAGVSRTRMQRLAEVTGDSWLHDLARSDVMWDRIVEITPLGPQPVFDATIETTHNFVANGVIAHNSLEQDADVVMFLYRDEVYNADSPDKGSAEVIVAKHRSGPIGTKRLVFLGQYTRFDNAARGV